MATRKFKKTAQGDMLWHTMASDIKTQENKIGALFILLWVEWCLSLQVNALIIYILKTGVLRKHCLEVRLKGAINENIIYDLGSLNYVYNSCILCKGR